VRQQLFHFFANRRVDPLENRESVLTRGVIELLDLLPPLRRQSIYLMGVDGGWYYDAAKQTLYTLLSSSRAVGSKRLL